MVVVGLVGLFAVALAGCGEPAYTYIKNSGDHTYFKVPRNWHQVNRDELDDPFSSADPDSAQKQLEKRLIWSIAYDAAPIPAAAHMFSSSDQPFVYSSVRPLTQSQQGGVSFDTLRNLVLPVTDARRQAAAQAGFNVDSFELLRDDVLTPGKGIRGIRVVYNYQFQGVLDTFDQTAYVNDAASRMYFLLIRCSARCYRQRTAELDGIATSFTVRSGL
jgi:hypothetical protein